jgi:hypothetical protein
MCYEPEEAPSTIHTTDLPPAKVKLHISFLPEDSRYLNSPSIVVSLRGDAAARRRTLAQLSTSTDCVFFVIYHFDCWGGRPWSEFTDTSTPCLPPEGAFLPKRSNDADNHQQ